MSQIARDHHFVPQSYLAGFTDTGTVDGRLCVYDFVAERFFRQKPKNVAFEVNFNRINVDGHPPDALEKAFGEFEGNAAAVIRRIYRSGELPADEDFSYVLNLIALLPTRNPRMRARRHAARVIGDLLIADRRTYEHHVAEAPRAGCISGADVPYGRMKGFISRDDYAIAISTDEHLRGELRVFERILESLGTRYWSLLVAAPDAPDLITCDHPANLVPKQITFPLDARHAIIGARGTPQPARLVASQKGIAEVNMRMINQADRQIYSRTPEVQILVRDDVVTLDLERPVGCRIDTK